MKSDLRETILCHFTRYNRSEMIHKTCKIEPTSCMFSSLGMAQYGEVIHPQSHPVTLKKVRSVSQKQTLAETWMIYLQPVLNNITTHSLQSSLSAIQSLVPGYD